MGNNKYKQKHMELGLCVYCSEPVYPDRKKCLKHLRTAFKAKQKWHNNNLKKDMEGDYKYKQALRDKGCCPMCSAPLDPEADAGRINCLNCREGTYYEVLINGTAIV